MNTPDPPILRQSIFYGQVFLSPLYPAGLAQAPSKLCSTLLPSLGP